MNEINCHTSITTTCMTAVRWLCVLYRYGFKIVVWRTSDRDWQWLGRMIRQSTLTFSTQPQRHLSTLIIRLWHCLHTDHPAWCRLRGSTTPAWVFNALPPPTAAASRRQPTSNSFPSLPAVQTSRCVVRLRLPRRHPSDHRHSSRTPCLLYTSDAADE